MKTKTRKQQWEPIYAKLIAKLEFVETDKFGEDTATFQHPDGFYYKVHKSHPQGEGWIQYEILTWVSGAGYSDYPIGFMQRPDGSVRYVAGSLGWDQISNIKDQVDRKRKAIAALMHPRTR
jgi:hypothetical protein